MINVEDMDKGRPEITTICGSTRFPTANALVMMHLSLRGRIVIPCGLQGHADEPPGARFLTGDGDESLPSKQGLDELHFRKIDISDGIFVVNVGGYIGFSTSREIDYALERGKKVEWMFPGGHRQHQAVRDAMRLAGDAPANRDDIVAATPQGWGVEGHRNPHMAVLLRAYAIYEARNMTYQDMWKKYGMKGSMVQLRNCVERMWTMVFENQAAEPKADDLFDAINYAVFALRCLTEEIPGDWRWE